MIVGQMGVPTMVVTVRRDLPGLFHAYVADGYGYRLEDFGELTVGQVRGVARQRCLPVNGDHPDHDPRTSALPHEHPDHPWSGV